MRRSCGKGREDNVFSRTRGCLALLLAVLLLFAGALLSSQTTIGGDDPEEGLNDIHWYKGPPIELVSQDFVVERDQTLYIDPGVVVHLGDDRGIDVKGRIIAQGTEEEPIHFTKKPGSSYPSPWRSIMFIEDQGSVLEHVIVTMSRNGLHLTSSSPTVRESTIITTRSAVIVDSRSGPSSTPLFVNATISSGIFSFDLDVSGDSWVTVLNTTFNGTNVRVGDPTAHIERQWFLDVQVENSLPELVEGASVTVEDNANGTAMLTRTTNSEGVASFVVTEYIDHYGMFGSNRVRYTPHTYRASKLGYNDSSQQTVCMDANKVVEAPIRDIEDPETTLVISGPKSGMDPTYIGTATSISFVVAPGGTQPVSTFYSIDGGSMTPYTGTPFTLQNAGIHVISYSSVDPAGNIESPKSKQVFLDKTAPEISATLNPVGDGSHPTIIESGTTMSIECTDDASGISNVDYSIQGGGFQPYSKPVKFSYPMSYNITYRAEDKVGNWAYGEIWFIIVTPVPQVINSPPEFIGTPIEQAKVGKDYAYHAQAVDQDEDVLTYELVNFPQGMEIDQSTGMITWTPNKQQMGQNLIMVVVSDGEGTDMQVFYIRVKQADQPGTDNLFLLLGAIGLVTVVLGSFTGLTEYGRFRFFLYFMVPLYSKLRRDKVLNQFLRGQIYGYIMAYPGENYSSIKKALNVENGTLTHHLYILEREGFVTSRVDGRYKRYYPEGVAAKKKAKASMIQKAILKMIRQNPSITQTDIAEALGTSKQVVNYHVKALVNEGLLSVAKNGSSLEYEDLSRRPGKA